MRVYLDHNSATLMPKVVQQATIEALNYRANPSSIHQEGRFLKQQIDFVRFQLADYFQTEPTQIIFTSGLTEVNNMILQAPFQAIGFSASCHSSVIQSAATKPHAESLPVDSLGRLLIPSLESFIHTHAHHSTLIILSHVNNELGTLQSLAMLQPLLNRYPNLQFYIDSGQSFAKLPLTHFVFHPRVSYGISAYKIGGPYGLGVAILSQDFPLYAFIKGGEQEFNLRAGTPNIPAILGFQAALNYSLPLIDSNLTQVQSFNQHIRRNLPTSITQLIPSELSSPYTLALTGHLSSQEAVVAFDLKGIAIGAGSACSSGNLKPSHILQAIGLTHQLEGFIRVSLSPSNNFDEISYFLTCCQEIYGL